MTQAGDTHGDQFVHKTWETPLFCERAQSLKQRPWLKRQLLITAICYLWLGLQGLCWNYFITSCKLRASMLEKSLISFIDMSEDDEFSIFYFFIEWN